jgi:ankyrin repeat protein
MKREMKSSIFKGIIFLTLIVILSGCTLFQKKSTIPTIEQVYSSILLDDAYRLNKYLIDGFPLDYENSDGKNLLVIALENNSLNSIDILLNKDMIKIKGITLEKLQFFM